ncbi:MAG: hypothetical protein AVDCRST_MAG01-01-834 [uncultured Rubrobacteraceae bacterium]|uniref:Uncharacterized protein n=1 Tax=uncultured Rubrobacteraceae bacterium TaxID=349277 RepID=A0A6J4P110_9ACTN|nr:MAG: hypothetical protein AVDCRST_MAG01-01-834 [uncultured Rubrobacteraceae bacterium]
MAGIEKQVKKAVGGKKKSGGSPEKIAKSAKKLLK